VLLATPNVPVSLHAIASDGNVSLFGQARIYTSAGSLLTTINLNHIAEGIYGIQYVPSVEGILTVIYQLYLDVDRTMPANFDKSTETIDVNSERTNITRILGLLYENSVFDQQTYSAEGLLLSGRVRSYDSKDNAVLAGGAGLLFTWTVESQYDVNNRLTNFRIKKES